MATIAQLHALAPRPVPAHRRAHTKRVPRPSPTFPRFSVSGARGRGNVASTAVFDPTQYDNANNTHHGNGQTSQPNSNARQYAQGSNVYHDPRMGRNASSGTSSHQNIASDTHTNFANPGEADYLPHLSATRQRFIDQEASAVRIRDYPVASRSAKILQRLVEIEEGLMTHETQEMEASLAQDYGTAAVAKRRKDGLLQEFYDLRFDKYDETKYTDARVVGGGSSSGGGGAGTLRASSLVTRNDGNSALAGSNNITNKHKAPSDTVPVRFTVNVQPQFGESVVVCGDLVELGAWDGTRGVPMEYNLVTKTWSCTVAIPQSSSFTFKFVVVGGLSPEEERDGQTRALFWQEGADRQIALPFDDALSLDVVVDWEGDGDKERMWLCMPVPKAPVKEVG